MRELVGFVLGLVFGVVVLAHLAHAHGSADWIRSVPDAAFCCGEQDCLALPDQAVKHLDDGGYAINKEWFPEIGGIRKDESFTRVFASVDGHYWACFKTWIQSGGDHGGHAVDAHSEWQHLPVRCLFVPAAGT